MIVRVTATRRLDSKYHNPEYHGCYLEYDDLDFPKMNEELFFKLFENGENMGNGDRRALKPKSV